MKFFTSVVTLLSIIGMIQSECVAKKNIEVCREQYRGAIDSRCRRSPSDSACYCTELDSLAACFDFCINESVYSDQKNAILEEKRHHCSAANNIYATGSTKSSPSASGSVTNVAYFANSVSGSAASKASSAVAGASRAASSAVASASNVASSAARSASRSASSSGKSSGAYNVHSSTNNLINIVVIGSLITYNVMN